MDLQRIVKVQHHIPQLDVGDRPIGIFAHNFIVVLDAGGVCLQEFDGLATNAKHQPDGLGGVVGFDTLMGYRTRGAYFYKPGHPQVTVFKGSQQEVAKRVSAMLDVQRSVNQLHKPYPFIGLAGDNSNSYTSTLMAAMGLPDVTIPGGWPSPRAGHMLLSPGQLTAIYTRWIGSALGGERV